LTSASEEGLNTPETALPIELLTSLTVFFALVKKSLESLWFVAQPLIAIENNAIDKTLFSCGS
jgi:hypothetical protein